MRTFNLITAWLLWTVTVLLWLIFLFIRVVNSIPPVAIEPAEAARYTKLFWGAMAMWSGFALIAFLVLRFFWHRSHRSPGFGFWFINVFLYLCVIFISASGFAPYFGGGDRGIIQWVALAVGALFLILGFPHLPSPQPQPPPPLPT